MEPVTVKVKLVIASIFIAGGDVGFFSNDPVKFVSLEWPDGYEDCINKAEHFNGVVNELYEGTTLDEPVAYCVKADRKDTGQLVNSIAWMEK